MQAEVIREMCRGFRDPNDPLPSGVYSVACEVTYKGGMVAANEQFVAACDAYSPEDAGWVATRAIFGGCLGKYVSNVIVKDSHAI